MKKYRILFIPLFTAIIVIAVVAYLMTGIIGSTQITGNHSDQWLVKKEETLSRLLKVPIILYHDIDGKGIYSVSSRTIRMHFDYFRTHDIRVVPLSDLIDRLENPHPYDGKVIVITFDDGYKNMYTRLLPIVKEYRYPITLFVYTDFIREKSAKALTWNELREMQKNGIDIQSHSISHPDLVKLVAKDTPQSREKLFRELFMSRKLIELKLGKNVDLLAFPFGYYDTKTIQYASFAGYRRVFSTDEGSNPVSRNNFCLRRHHIINNYPLNKIIEIIE
jgi:peptidoglycan/xylan/chitin deacetylase (PgdA/CDA1 family)